MNERLMETIAAPENLLAAWRAVRGNIPGYRRMRAAGPDRVTFEDYERDLPAQLGALRHMLLNGRYRPHPASAVRLPKRGGGEREIAVLTITDRVAQRAAQQVLEPLWESHFLPCSYGYRPGRSTRDAVTAVKALRSQGKRWMVDGDIKACFDTLDHHLLIERVGRRVADARVLRLVESWLSAGLLTAQPTQPGPFEAARQAAARVGRGLPRLDTPRLVPPDPALFIADELDADDLPGGVDPWADDSGLENLAGLDQVRQRQAWRQVASNGMVLGASLARPYLRKVGEAALAAMRSPAGRALLLKNSLAALGVGGILAGAAAGVLLLSRPSTAAAGVLQGGPLSPLLANIYLHSFDLALTQAGFDLVRFADDWVIACSDQDSAEKAYNQAVRSLARIRLKINPAKTHILTPADPLDWLGSRIA